MNWYTAYVERYLSGDEDNDAQQYGARIERVEVAQDAHYWRAVGVHHLTPEQNMGRQNIYVELRNRDGQTIRNQTAVVATFRRSESRQAETARLDKGEDEPATNFPVFPGDRVEVWIQGRNLPSDRVANLHTRHDQDEMTSDGRIGSSRFHHSFLVVFQESTKAAGGPPPLPLEERMRRLAWDWLEAGDRHTDLAFYARVNRLGAPIGTEFQAKCLRVQSFAAGIVYTQIDEPGEIFHIPW